MCFDERNTLSRGRSEVPRTRLRTWCRFRCRVTANRFCACISVTLRRSVAYRLLGAAGKRFAFLAADHFVLVADALTLVWLRLSRCADFGGELPDLLLVGAFHDDRRRVRHVGRHAFL